MNVQFPNEVTVAILAARIRIDSFDGCLCSYQDTVHADGIRIPEGIFAGDDCYASNYRRDKYREADIPAIRDLVAESSQIVVKYHDKGNGDVSSYITFTRQESGKWIKEVEYL